MKSDPYMLDSNKLLYHMDRVLKWEKGERVAPLLIDIGATKICNIKCKYCYGIYQKMDNSMMIPPEKLVQLFHDAPLLGVKALTLTGDGEPTLNPGMWDALMIGKKNGLDIGIATNGVALNEDKIKVILKTAVWCRFNISAGTKETYKDIHGADYFNRVVDNIVQMRTWKSKLKSNTTIGLQMVLIPECLDDVIPLAEIAVKYGLDYFVIKQFSDPGDDVPCEQFSPEDFRTIATPILQQAEAMSKNSTKIIVKWNLLKLMNKRAYDKCIDCPFIFQVSGSSKCYPCGYLFGNDKYCYGDLKHQSLGEIITSEQYWKVVDYMANEHDVHKDCKGCCRHDSTNAWLNKYVDKPQHMNFI